MLKKLVQAVTTISLASVAFSWTAPHAAQSTDTIVTIDSGAIQGAISRDVVSFKGIPYAAPPVGALRWREPRPVTPWRETRSATKYGPDCMQKPVGGDVAPTAGEFGEDCLFVSVWRPMGMKADGRLPVLVWIHGGGFLNGGTTDPFSDASALARHGLVVVKLNYRLGRLGFFMHPALKPTGEDAPANYAFLDQLAALQWVRRNIAAFGGDPQQVTIAGESAGGVSVMHHLTWPAAHGLFQRAVVMSGGGRTYGIGAPTVARAEEAGLAFAKTMGIAGTGADALAALRALPVEKVNGDLSMEALITKPASYAGGPIPDGKVVTSPSMPGDALRNRAAAKVPVLIGTTSDDLPVVFPPRDNPLSFFGANATTAKAVYFVNADPATALKNIAVDITMHEPARFAATQVVATGQPAWLYRFGYVAESQRPKGTAAHASEIPYFFGVVDARYGAATTAKDRAMADILIAYIATFAKTGDPNRSGLPAWPRYDATKSELMMFTPEAAAIMQADPWKARLDLIERALDKQATGRESAFHPAAALGQGKVAAWLDEPKPTSWNKPGLAIPGAPKIEDTVDLKCRELARPLQLDEDKRLRDEGWNLVGAYQGGWQVLVIRGTAGYDGMCRPRQYQDFVFVRGLFAGTLSPQPMDSRADGALARVSLQSSGQLVAEYERYTATDPLCCPSRTTRVVFEIANEPPVVRPASVSTTDTRVASPGAAASKPLEGNYWRAIELAGKPTPAQDAKREAHLQFLAGDRVSGSDGCNRITGSYQLKGDQVTFGQMVGTQMACLNPSGLEGPFRDALKSATRLMVAGDRLELFDPTGTRLAAFAAGTQAAGLSPSLALAGTSWQLVKFQGSDDATLTPDDGTKYTVEFGAAGRLTARIDCNRGRGTWKSSGPNQIDLGPLALTRAKCPAGSMHDQIVKQWGNIRSYVIRDGHLFLALMADGGIYQFEPVATKR